MVVCSYADGAVKGNTVLAKDGDLMGLLIGWYVRGFSFQSTCSVSCEIVFRIIMVCVMWFGQWSVGRIAFYPGTG